MEKDNSNRATRPMPEDQTKELTRDDMHVDETMLTACEEISGERYQAFVDNIEEGLYEVDIHGNYIYFNNALCKIFGYPREEIQFQNFSKFMDERDAKKVFETFNRIYRTGKGISDLIWKIKDKNGHLRVIELSANLITDNEGQEIGFRGIARDITEKFMAREALRKSERRYKTLLDFVPYPIVVFTVEGRVSYLNPAFTETFGWTLEELEGRTIPYVPRGLEEETSENIRRLFHERIILRNETQRLTKDGKILDVAFRAAVYSVGEEESPGELVILRDITHEKRITRNNEALLRASMALPEYPDLDELLDYINGEVKRLLGVEGALVILLDEEKNELFFKSASHDDFATEKRMKEVRFPANEHIASKVILSGEPIIITDTSKDPSFDLVADNQVGLQTKNILAVPLRSKDRIIGVLYAMNKKIGTLDKTDAELLSMLAGTVALSIENARFSAELREAYKEVTSLNRAKDKVINHLSHELKTPLSVLSASLNILAKRLSSLPAETWRPTMERAERNLERILEMQYQVGDIMHNKHDDTYRGLTWLLNECADELESLIAEEVGEGQVVEKIRRRIDEVFGSKESPPEIIMLDESVSQTIEEIRPLFSHRHIDIVTHLDPGQTIKMPMSEFRKVVLGLIKNAVENTPDGGKIEIFTRKWNKGTVLSVRDYGVGITAGNQHRIFEGFFSTQEIMNYSSKRPFDFNAGGKGADLLRMKIFSEQYDFKIKMKSSRCQFIPRDEDICPGKISDCVFCENVGDCLRSGGTSFSLFFQKDSNSPEVDQAS